MRLSLALTIGLVAGAAHLCGCATEQAPTAATPPAAKATTKTTLTAKVNTDDEGGYVVAIAPRTARSVTAPIGPDGGELIVEETGGRPQDNLLVCFTVPPGALTATESITMTVEGDLLSQIVVDFLRPGLTFTPWATLYLHLGGERVDVDPTGLQAVHILADGTEVVVDSRLYTTGNSNDWQIWVDVPGFSRYGLR